LGEVFELITASEIDRCGNDSFMERGERCVILDEVFFLEIEIRHLLYRVIDRSKHYASVLFCVP